MTKPFNTSRHDFKQFSPIIWAFNSGGENAEPGIALLLPQRISQQKIFQSSTKNVNI